MNLKFLFPLIGLTVGIYLSDVVFFSLLFPAISIALALLVWIGITIISKNPLKALKYSKYHNLWIFLLFMGLGSIDFNFNSRPFIEREIENSQLNFTGEITDVRYLTQGDRFKIKILSLSDTSGNPIRFSNLNFLVSTDGYVGNIGDQISLSAKPQKFGYENSSSDYSNSMRHQGLSYSVNIKSDKIRKIGESNSVIIFFNQLRDDLVVLIENSSLDRETSDFLISILLGDKSFLSEPTRTSLNSAGLAHVLALSGMHVAIMLSLFLAFLFPLSFFGMNNSRRFIAILMIWIYVLITGASPSTIRAAIMATFVTGAFILQRKNSALNALLAAVVLILLINPLYLWDIGLQLSFLCVASILLFLHKLNPIDHHSHPLLYKGVDLVLISLVTTLSSWALIAYYFHSLPLLFLPANFILLPLLPFFVGAGMLYLLLLCIGIDFGILAGFLQRFYSGFLYGADFLSMSGDSAISVSLPFLSVVLWLTAVLFLAFAIHSSVKRNKLASSIISAGLIAASFIIIGIQEEPKASSLKFLHNYSRLEVHHYDGDKVNRLEFPSRSVSSSEYKDFHILSIDAPLNTENLSNIKDHKPETPLYLLIGQRADVSQIAELIDEWNFSRVILHSRVTKKKKTELLRLMNEKNWHLVYSLRETGSLDFEL